MAAPVPASPAMAPPTVPTAAPRAAPLKTPPEGGGGGGALACTLLRQHVWVGTHVTDTVLRVSVKEIRAALGDAATAPWYLETVGSQGYRFLVGGDLDSPPLPATGPVVGRQGKVDALEAWFRRAAQGVRHL
jgi:Transcriptional regulatory protein, C terminal